MENRVKKILILFFAVMIIFTFVSRAAASVMVAKVQTDKAKSGDLNYMAEGTGIVKADAHKYIRLMNDYKIGRVAVKEGQKVSKGDLLFAYDVSWLKEMESDKEDELEKLQLQCENIGLTGAAEEQPNTEAEGITLKSAREDIDAAKKDIADKKIAVAKNKEKEYSTAVADTEAVMADKATEEKAAARAVADAETGLAKVNEPETAVKEKINDYEAAVKSGTDAQINEEYDNLFEYYYDGNYEEHKRLVNSARLKLQRAEEDLKSKHEERDNISIKYYVFSDIQTRDQLQEKLQQKEEELKNAQREEEDAKEALDELTEADNKLSEAIVNYCTGLKNGTVAISLLYDPLYQILLKKAAVKETDINDAQTKLDRAKEDQEDTISKWDKKLSDSSAKRDKLYQDLQAIKDGSYDYTEDLKDENKALEQACRVLEKAKLDLNQAREAMKSSGESRQKQEESQEISKRILEIDIRKKQQEVSKLQSMIAKKGKVLAPAAGVISDNDLEQGITLSGQEKLVISVEGYELNMTADKEDMRYFAAGDELTIATGQDNESIKSKIENIELPDKDGKVIFTALLPKGDYRIGGSLSFSLNKTSQSYRDCIPIQALHKDSDSTYVLLVKEKDSVLGKVEEAFRMNVTVLSKDGKTAAIEAALSDEDKIITGSNKNISEGDRVRTYEVD